MAKKNKKQFDPFDDWRESHFIKRERYVRIAINALKTSDFKSMTSLAEGVAKVVTQFELNDAGLTEKTDKVKGIVSSTLLSKRSKYKPLIEAEWALREGLADEGEQAVSDVDELTVRCANLAHQNDLLLKRLEHKGQPELTIGPDPKLEKKDREIGALIELVNGMFGQVSDLFTTVMEGDEDDEHPVAGMYGPDGFIVGIEVLNLFMEAQNERKA